MYEKSRSILLRSTASALAHNLDVLRGDSEINAVVVHKYSVNVIKWNPTTGKQTATEIQCKYEPGTRNTILQAKWCNINGTIFVGIIIQDGLQIYDATTAEMQLFYHFEKGYSGECLEAFDDSHIAIGYCDGTVAILQFGPKLSNAVLSETLHTGWDVPVTSIASSAQYLACGGTNGQLLVWESSKPYLKIHSIHGYGFPCTSICFWKKCTIVAYGSGHLRLFDITMGIILLEITAHAKWINAMDVSQSQGLVLSASEDSFARVWKLSESNENPISLVHNECVPDTQLFGAKFLDTEGMEFVVSGFESEEIICYSKIVE